MIGRLFIFFTLLVMSSSAFGENYCVATNGDDRNPGTSLDQPFASVQHAVDTMRPGDTCYIRGGVYHEAVDLCRKAGVAGHPITLTSYKDEKVTLSGATRIDGKWTIDRGNVYKTIVNQDVTQLFVDGKLMTLARFPNALAFSDDVWHRTAARCHKSRDSTNGHVIDAGRDARAISNAGHSFNGCVVMLNFGAHATASRIVENHAVDSGEFDYSPELFKYKTTSGYFFEGGIGNAERAMLDMAQEWAFDESTKTLYLWADDGENPSGRRIYGKTQTYAITGDAATKHIVIDGLNFFATTFSFANSDYITISNCHFNYYASSKRALGILGPSETASFKGDSENFCSHITVYNCEFRFADASALLGDYVESMRIENNLFSHVDYACVNNDTGKGNPFSPSSTIRMNKVQDLIYKRNTLTVAGNAQGFSANRFLKRRFKRFNPEIYNPESIRPVICEYNFHNACGLTHTDGASMYLPDMHVMESVARYNWFIGNGQRDFRWDGNNKPLTGVHGNLYRNVAVGTGVKKMSPSGGNGFRVKGSYHEVFNNLGLGYGGELNIATEKGGNAQTITRNNAATRFTDHPVPGINSNNYGDSRKSNLRLKNMVRDWTNWDFRPKADAFELIDQGLPVRCSIKGKRIDVTAGYIGEAPDIGAYEFGDDCYWIPGRQTVKASMPIPKDGGRAVKLDADLMYLIGLEGKRAGVYFGPKPNELTAIVVHEAPRNIVTLAGYFALKEGETYYWRVDTQRADKTVVKGDVWSFTTATGDQDATDDGIDPK